MSYGIIYISPSKHGKNANKCLNSGCYEDKHTRPMAEAFAKYLEASGFEPVIAKAELTMKQRTEEADRLGAVAYFPIHTNASSYESARYLLFMCYSTSGKYKTLFNCVKKYFEPIYDGSIQLTKRNDLYEINAPKAMTFYVEAGFHTNKYDCANFIHKPDVIGKALAQGFCDYMGVPFKEPAKPVEKPATTSNTYTGSFPKLPSRGYFQNGDKGAEVLKLQKFLNWWGASLKEDSDFGDLTEQAVKVFQEAKELEADGLFGKASLAKAKSTPKGAKYSGTFPSLPRRGYFKYGDTGINVGRLQAFLNWWKPSLKLKEDQELGTKTADAVGVFQKATGLVVDKEFGKASLAKAKACKK